MIDYKEKVSEIFSIMLSGTYKFDVAQKDVEEIIRKVGHEEYLRGYTECQKKEAARHEYLRSMIDEARAKIPTPRSDA